MSGYPAGQRLPVALLIHPPEGVGLTAPQEAGGAGPALALSLHRAPGLHLEQIQITAAPQNGLYHDLLPIKAWLRVEADAAPGQRIVPASFVFALKDGDPQTFNFDWQLDILPAGDTARPVYSPATASLLGLKQDADNPSSTGTDAAEPEQAAPAGEDILAGHSLAVILLLVFLGGLALNLTPCVYPVIPITISYFVAQAGSSRRARLLGATAYWLGMVVMYSALGLLASLSGGILGHALTNMWVVLALVLVLLALAASMLGFWEIKMPSKLNNMAATNRHGLSGALLMGLTVGVLAAPCLGPFVLGLMTHVATSGNVIYGTLLFFVLSLGLGLPLAVLAFFSGSITSLPGAGEWMVWVRKFFGIILIIMAIYVAQPLLSEAMFVVLLSLTALAGGLYLAFEKSGRGKFMIVKKSVGLLMALAALAFACQHYTADKHSSQQSLAPWLPYTFEALQNAKGRPAVLDFTAAWCQPCRQMEAQTFPDPAVQDKLKLFTCFKVDVTNGPPNSDAAQMVTQLQIKGVPTLIFLDNQGRVMPEYTIVGFVDAPTMANHLTQALAAANR